MVALVGVRQRARQRKEAGRSHAVFDDGFRPSFKKLPKNSIQTPARAQTAVSLAVPCCCCCLFVL